MPPDPLRRPALALAAWSAFVWGNRLNNLRSDDTEGGAVALSVVLSSVSLAAAGATVVAVLLAWRAGRPLGAGAARLVQAFAAWTVGVWIVRAIDIALDWRSPGFVVVHVALAVVSWLLAAWAWRAAARSMAPAAAAAA